MLNTRHLHDSILVGFPEDLAPVLDINEMVGSAAEASLFCLFSLSLTILNPAPLGHYRHLLEFLSIGPPAFCEEVLQDRTKQVKISLGIVHDIGNTLLNWKLLSFARVLLPPSSPISSTLLLPVTSVRQLGTLTLPPGTPWNPYWVNLRQSGYGKRHAF